MNYDHPIGDPKALGELVRRRRSALGLTQIELANVARTSPRFIGELENGKPTVQLDAVMRVLAALGIRLGAGWR